MSLTDIQELYQSMTFSSQLLKKMTFSSHIYIVFMHIVNPYICSPRIDRIKAEEKGINL